MSKDKPTPDEVEPEIEPSEITELGQLADTKKVKTEREKQKLAELQRTLDLQAVMATPAGRRFVLTVLESTGVDLVAFNMNAKVTSYNLGLQHPGEVLRARMRRDCLELMRLMEDEEMNV
jgi:hypothetical protein